MSVDIEEETVICWGDCYFEGQFFGSVAPDFFFITNISDHAPGIENVVDGDDFIFMHQGMSWLIYGCTIYFCSLGSVPVIVNNMPVGVGPGWLGLDVRPVLRSLGLSKKSGLVQYNICTYVCGWE